MKVWKIIFLSKWVICRFHVNLPGCKASLHPQCWYYHLGQNLGSNQWIPFSNANLRYGLRLIVDSSGIGRQISLVPIVIQLGSCYLATFSFSVVIFPWRFSASCPVGLKARQAESACHVMVFLGEKSIFQNSPGLALVQIASMAADFLMVRMYDKDRRDAYYRCKACDENFCWAYRYFHRA